MGRMSRLKESS
uniref:Uncharacterized protein n=1 Tax=Moniliophthora roreri TaxID=221103 RepID=A0A0W0FXQ2_MONRR